MARAASRLITRNADPRNLESPFAALRGGLTPTADCFVRCHFPTPRINAARWRLSLEGAVEHPSTLSLDALQSLGSSTRSAVIECSGNSRLFLDGKAESIQWELGAVSCASWTGVPLATVLEQAGVRGDAFEVVFEGADLGDPEKPTKPQSEIHYARSLPLSVARRSDVLLAYAMNGKPIDRDHGGPLRLVVPGWYGMAWVKWLTRVVVVTAPFSGYFQSAEYTRWQEREAGTPERVAVTEMAVKSEIARPSAREKISVGRPYRIHGAAWTSNASITSVDVSTDGGERWAEARLGEPPAGLDSHAWRLWDLEWIPERTGMFTLMSRATDSRGRMQPREHDANNENYMIHHTLPIRVEVI